MTNLDLQLKIHKSIEERFENASEDEMDRVCKENIIVLSTSLAGQVWMYVKLNELNDKQIEKLTELTMNDFKECIKNFKHGNI